MIARIIALAVCLTVGGCVVETNTHYHRNEQCARGKTYMVRTAADMDPRYLAGLTRGLDSWSLAMGGKFQYQMDPKTPPTDAFEACVINVLTDDTIVADNDATGHDQFDYDGSIRAGVILILRQQFDKKIDDPVYVHGVMIHEIGHVMGLGHQLSEDYQRYRSIMWPYITVDKIGCEDLRRMCMTWECDPGCSGNGWLE